MANEIKVEILEKGCTSAKISISSEPVGNNTIASIKVCSRYTTEKYDANEVIYEEVVDISAGESLEWIHEINELEAGEVYYVFCDIDSWSSGEVDFTMESGFGVFLINKTAKTVEIEIYGPSSGYDYVVDFKVYKKDDPNTSPYHASIPLESGNELWWRGTIDGLTPNTEYEAVVDYGDNYTRYSTTFKTYSDGTIGSSGCKVTITKITYNSASFNVTKGNNLESAFEINFMVCLKEAPNVKSYQDTASASWTKSNTRDKEFSFTELVSDMTYILKTPGFDDDFEMEFTTNKISGCFLTKDAESITSFSVGAKASNDINAKDYDDWGWKIRDVSGSGVSASSSDSSKHCTFNGLKSETTYLVTLYWTRIAPLSGTETMYQVGIYITTLPSEEFQWTYAGMKKNEDGTYELVWGEEKGAGDAEYFYLGADEWNEYVTVLCETKDSQDLSSLVTDGTLDKLKVNPNDVFKASLYNDVLRILYDLDNVGEMPDAYLVYPGDDITPDHLNNIKNRLNNVL